MCQSKLLLRGWVFLLLLVAGGARAAAQPAPPGRTLLPGAARDRDTVFREKTDVVTLTVTVTDADQRMVAELGNADFEIYEDNVRQQIEYFSDADAPASVGIIFDLSGSMAGKLEDARAALRTFVQTSHPDDDFFGIGFNRRPNLLLEFADAATLVRQLDLLGAGGNTALFDAAYLGVEKARQGRHAKRVLLVISDGEDNASRYSFGQLRQLLKEAGVQVYCVGVGVADEARRASPGRAVLDEMAKVTGGRAFFVTSAAELEEATTRIALELRRQYSLGYTPTNAERDGRWRGIKVRVSRAAPRVQIRAKAGYYALP